MSTATGSFLALALTLASAAAFGREASTADECRAAGARPPVAEAKKAAEKAADDLEPQFRLADAWSDAGCFPEAVEVLQQATPSHPDSPELKTRLRVARSLVGEEHFFDDLDRADLEARLKRATFRCRTLSDAEACAEAVRMRPEDPALLTAQGDALMKVNRAREAAEAYRRAGARAPNERDLPAKLAAAENALGASAAERPPRVAENSLPAAAPSPEPTAMARLQPAKRQPVVRETMTRTYSNAEEDAQSH